MYRDRYQQRCQISVKGCAISIVVGIFSLAFLCLLLLFFSFTLYAGLWVFRWVFDHPVFIDNVPTVIVDEYGNDKLIHYYSMLLAGVPLSYYIRSDWETLSIPSKVMYICALALLSVTMITVMCVHVTTAPLSKLDLLLDKLEFLNFYTKVCYLEISSMLLFMYTYHMAKKKKYTYGMWEIYL